jgi:hypothetical protein
MAITIAKSHGGTTNMWSRMATMRNRMSASEIGAVQEGGNISPPELKLAYTCGVQGTTLIPRSDNDDDDFVEVMLIDVSSRWSTHVRKLTMTISRVQVGPQKTIHLVHRQRQE